MELNYLGHSICLLGWKSCGSKTCGLSISFLVDVFLLKIGWVASHVLNGKMAFLQDSFDTSYVHLKFEQFETIQFNLYHCTLRNRCYISTHLYTEATNKIKNKIKIAIKKIIVVMPRLFY